MTNATTAKSAVFVRAPEPDERPHGPIDVVAHEVRPGASSNSHRSGSRPFTGGRIEDLCLSGHIGAAVDAESRASTGDQDLAARQHDGAWQLHGEKWFCSHTDADVALMLARPEGAPAPPRLGKGADSLGSGGI